MTRKAGRPAAPAEPDKKDHVGDIEWDQYDKINLLSGEVRELSGQVRQSNVHMEQLVGLLKSALLYMFWIIIVLIGTVIYGAIGERGFNCVTDRLPAPVSQAIIPWHQHNDEEAQA